MKIPKTENNKNVLRKKRIREIIHENGACLVCIRRKRGKVKKYKTRC